ncbi:flagellar biosynthesis protein FlhB [Mobilitalea sibirica]|uniref:Flagellar biosynthetic protein FlhB n=1 Tax=Mobilitalea sibirica TaxID=1462919 RepID=A0A8J7HEE4_9FIRM|nr:flagellar biosynthesis protein FlhB [Mobilitalea sibirica]MBH1942004.1 flagellar biosynthesis protein FlhB [Mobilitalea sibirica]
MREEVFDNRQEIYFPNSSHRQISHILPYRLQFFAKEGNGGEKTEEATTKKLNDARLEGQVARSTELITATALITLFLVLKAFMGYISDRFIEAFHSSYQNIDKVAGEEFNTAVSQGLLYDAIMSILMICLPIFLSGLVVAFVVTLMQVKWKISGKTLKPKFSKLNPISGFKKIFSVDKAVTLVMELLKILVIAYICYDTLKDEWKTLVILYDINLEQAIMLIGKMVIDLGLKISLLFLIIGLADFIYQKMKFKKDMRMTKQEVKDEFKNSEGDPQIKSKIRSKMREVSQRRMMQALPQADVVITNPTHFAAAVKYDKETADAPILIAKGADYLAQKIKETAKEHGIEIVENKPLARMLYYNVEIGAEIPPELYQMTAEVLAYVYGLKNKI